MLHSAVNSKTWSKDYKHPCKQKAITNNINIYLSHVWVHEIQSLTCIVTVSIGFREHDFSMNDRSVTTDRYQDQRFMRAGSRMYFRRPNRKQTSYIDRDRSVHRCGISVSVLSWNRIHSGFDRCRTSTYIYLWKVPLNQNSMQSWCDFAARAAAATIITAFPFLSRRIYATCFARHHVCYHVRQHTWWCRCRMTKYDDLPKMSRQKASRTIKTAVLEEQSCSEYHVGSYMMCYINCWNGGSPSLWNVYCLSATESRLEYRMSASLKHPSFTPFHLSLYAHNVSSRSIVNFSLYVSCGMRSVLTFESADGSGDPALDIVHGWHKGCCTARRRAGHTSEVGSCVESKKEKKKRESMIRSLGFLQSNRR